MTVSSTTNRKTYAADGTSTTFAFPYYFGAQADLIVTTIDSLGNIVTKVLTTDYSVTGTVTNGVYAAGGSVVFGVAPVTGLTISIVRAPAATQPTHWVDGDPDPAATKEGAFDKLTTLYQRALDLIGRAIVLPDGFSGTYSNQLPAVLPANSSLATNSSGTGWVLVAGTANPGTVTSVALSVPTEFAASAAVTTSGTLTMTKVSQSANSVWAAPNGSAGVPVFRALVAADIPALTLTAQSSGAATNGQVLVANGLGGASWSTLAGSGTVTSVGLSAPAEFTISGSPVTASGTLTFAKATQTANTVWAGPSTGAPSTPVFRNLVPADLPIIVGATSLADGTAGIAPAPHAGDQAKFLRGDGTWAAGNAGTVTSLALSMPGEFSVSPASITSSGTFTVTKVNQSANTFYAGPGTGVAAAPAFRAVVPADLPVMVGATGLAAGIAGTVPTPSAGQNAYFLRGDGTWSTVGAGTGTVQSVGLSMPADFTVSNSPVTGIGTLTAVYATQSANIVHAGPTSGVAAAPTWRSLVVADLPTGYIATDLNSGAATNGEILTANGLGGATWQPASATGVTSVGLSSPAEFSVSGSPVTTSGTLTFTKVNQNANTVWAGPTTGVAAAPGFRALIAADIPPMSGATSSLAGTGGGVPAPTAGQQGLFLRGDGTWATGGTVTSVGLAMPADFTISGSPVTGTGTLTAVWTTQAKNTVLAGPTTGVNAAPTWRAVIAADVSSGAASNLQVLMANGSGAASWQSLPAGGQLAVSGTRAAPSLITAAGGVTSTTSIRQLLRIAGSGGAVTITANPQISAGTTDGQELILEGSSDTSTVTINNGTGVEQNGPKTLAVGDKAYYIWNAGAAVWTCVE